MTIEVKWEDIKNIIDTAMDKRDRSVLLSFYPDGSCSISFYPYTDDNRE